MLRPLRLIHTADLHIGAVPRLAPRAAARVSGARIEVLERLLQIARQNRADALLICGDLFDSNTVPDDLLRSVLQVLAAYAPLPIHIIPGNHDPFDQQSIYRHSLWQELPNLGHVAVHTQCGEAMLAGTSAGHVAARLLVCPLAHRKSLLDPTAWIGPPAPGDVSVLRIAMAHGSVAEVLPQARDDHPISTEVVERCQLDYLAMGHWHTPWPSRDQVTSRRLAYCGTPEPLSFGETAAGYALDVTLEPTRQPIVRLLRTAALTWVVEPLTLPIADLPGHLQRLHLAQDNPADTLLRLRLSGVIDPASRRILDQFVAQVGDQYALLDIADAEAHTPGIGHSVTSQVPLSRTLEQVMSQLQQARSDPDQAATADRAIELLEQAIRDSRA